MEEAPELLGWCLGSSGPASSSLSVSRSLTMGPYMRGATLVSMWRQTLCQLSRYGPFLWTPEAREDPQLLGASNSLLVALLWSWWRSGVCGFRGLRCCETLVVWVQPQHSWGQPTQPQALSFFLPFSLFLKIGRAQPGKMSSVGGNPVQRWGDATQCQGWNSSST